MEPSSSSDKTTTHHRSHDLFICFTSMKTSSSSKSPTRQGSAMFNTASKKRGSGAESNPEPTSPKVTCIGQVRVKTKKQGDKMRNLSRRSAEMSFRKVMQRQSSFNSIHHQQECSSHRNQRWVHLPLTLCETLRSEFSCLFPCKSSCLSQSAHCRDDLEEWMNDEEDYEDEKVVRRHVFDEIEIKDCFEQGGRVSLCVPPKNALLLMRCRSDPVKMEALAKKVWEPKLQDDDHDDHEEEDCNDENDAGNVDVDHVVGFDKVKVVEVFEERRASISYNIENQENLSDVKLNVFEDLHGQEQGNEICEPSHKEELEESKCAQDGAIQGEGNGQVLERDDRRIKNVEREGIQGLPECLLLMMCEPKLSMEVSKETWVCSTDFVRNRGQKKKSHAPPFGKTGDGDVEAVVERRKSVDSRCGDNPFAALPPLYPAARDLQPGRSSCCLPEARGGVSMASMIEQKLGDAVAYEPFVLTRCKSEPMRTASKLAQEGCFWKNKALEPHGRAPFGVGAAGAGC